MRKLFRFLVHSLLLLVLAVPLVANKGCGEALEEAEEDKDKKEEVNPAGSPNDENEEIVPGTKILESGGPEVKSAPPPEE